MKQAALPPDNPNHEKAIIALLLTIVILGMALIKHIINQ